MLPSLRIRISARPVEASSPLDREEKGGPEQAMLQDLPAVVRQAQLRERARTGGPRDDWLAASRAAVGVGAVEGGSRRGATAEQRQAAAEGCRELEFDLPRYGRIKVVCGQEGRRDTWDNVWIGQVRYGFNGERWARGMTPPAAVVEGIKERGIEVFG